MSRAGRPPNAGKPLSDATLLNHICERIVSGEPIRKICSGTPANTADWYGSLSPIDRGKFVCRAKLAGIAAE